MDRQFGRLYVRLRLCELLQAINWGPTYGETVEEMKQSSIAAWHEKNWDQLIEMLDGTKDACLRRDRGVAVLSASAEEDASIDPALVDKRCFTKGHMYPAVACRLNRMLAPLRFKLEKQLMEGKTGAPKANVSRVKELL